MFESITTFVVTAASTLLFAFWFRSACLLILVAKPPRDYARGVAIANQLAFGEVQEALCSSALAQFRPLKDALDEDFRVILYLLKHATVNPVNAIETRMLRVDYWAMSIWSATMLRLSPRSARRALQEMAMIVAHFANTLGEQLATA